MKASGNCVVKLKRGRERTIANGHPWVFSGAIAGLDGAARVGDQADVVAHDGTWLARGLIHPEAALAVRLYARTPGQALDDAFFGDLVDRALALRQRLFEPAGDTDAYRLIYSEADGISGLIVDRYADTLAVQVVSRALLPYLPAMLDRLRERTGLEQIVALAEPDAVAREGLDLEAVARLGQGNTDAPTRIHQDGLVFEVDPAGGQKTGFFLDQRGNRGRVAAYVRNRTVLSAYCYTGAFEIYAAAADARSITGIDRSAAAIAQAETHHRLNGSSLPVEYIRADVPITLRAFRDTGRQFEVVILDPPRFVVNRAQLGKGLRAYKDINLLALKLLAPGGILATFSCSGLVSDNDFRMAVAWAAKDAGRNVRVIETLHQPPDHPIQLGFPESAYLKGLIGWVE